MVIAPDRVIAGQFLTSAVIQPGGIPEELVELNFNSAILPSDKKGQASFMVPEEAEPGQTLAITLAASPELNPKMVEVLQPLNVTTRSDVPIIDRISPLVVSNRLAVIDGHNFDGLGEHNHVVIDGAKEARVLASSPVQLKVRLPDAIEPGKHSLMTSAHGQSSSTCQFELASARVLPDTRAVITKVTVRVLGTTSRVRVHLINRSPDVIRISQGNDIILTTPGGTNNLVVIAAQKLRKGSYKLEATVE